MGIMSIIGMIVVGFIVGLLARFFYPGAVSMGFWMTTLMGIGGSLVGGVIGEPAVEVARRPLPAGGLDPVHRRRDDPDLGLSQLPPVVASRAARPGRLVRRTGSARPRDRAATGKQRDERCRTRAPATPTPTRCPDATLSRRQVLQGGVAAAIASMFGLSACATGTGRHRAAAARRRSASGRCRSRRRTRWSCPDGYRATVLFAWGDPVGAVAGSPAFRFDASNTAAEQALQAGMHHDGMQYFPLPYGSADATHGLLAINHEYHSDGLLFPDGSANWSAAKVAKAIAASGVSVIEVEQKDGAWRVVRPSTYARRITADTPCTISGPAAGADLMKTARDPSGREALGTFAGCAHGWTPWGTYLTCEENFQDRFVNTGTRDALQVRDLIPAKSRAMWEAGDERFDAAGIRTNPTASAGSSRSIRTSRRRRRSSARRSGAAATKARRRRWRRTAGSRSTPATTRPSSTSTSS